MKTLRYMGHAMGLLLRSAMQYRASFLMQTLSQAVMTGGDLLAVAVLLGRFTRLGPWSGPESAVLLRGDAVRVRPGGSSWAAGWSNFCRLCAQRRV